jgi:hypothetical protein
MFPSRQKYRGESTPQWVRCPQGRDRPGETRPAEERADVHAASLCVDRVRAAVGLSTESATRPGITIVGAGWMAGIEVHEGIGKTGVVGVLQGNRPGRTIGLRADMDALPIDEQTNLPWSSKTRA